MKIEIDAEILKGKCEIVFSGKSVRAYLLERQDKPEELQSAIYILMDQRRSCFYIGQTGNTSHGGFAHRFRSHKSSKTEKWWDIALCFTDSSELFDKPPVRAWLESKLTEIARERHVVISTAAAPAEPPSNAQSKLEEILWICQLLGIPLAIGKLKQEPPPALPSRPVQPKMKEPVPVTVSHPARKEKWENKTQLAQLIAKRDGNEGAYGGILQYFAAPGAKARKPCSQSSKWRKPLEDAGVKFDSAGFVLDWTCARNPL